MVPATIHSLPTEIKTRIAELCHLQDQAFLHVFEELDNKSREPCQPRYDSEDEDDDDDDDDDDEEDEVDAAIRNHRDEDDDEETATFKLGAFSDRRWLDAAYPKSLLSLSSVSREWHEIGVKFIFRKVTALLCSKPIFALALAPQYGHLVEELEIAHWPDSFSTINILSSLSHLPKVRRVVLPSVGHVYKQLAKQARSGKFPVEFASIDFVARALRRVIQHAEVAVLSSACLRETISICCGTNLAKLELEPTRDDLPLVLSAIMSCPNLRTLSITTDFDDEHAFRYAASLPDVSHPTLRRLEVSDLSGGDGLLDFVERFASTLEELELFWGVGTGKKTKMPDDRDFRLPRLQQLEIRGELEMTAPLVRYISPSAFPTLRTCNWVLYDQGRVHISSVLSHTNNLLRWQVDRTVPLKFTIDFDEGKNRVKIDLIIATSGNAVGAEQGNVEVHYKRSPPDTTESRLPPDLILTPKLCRTDDSKVDQLGEIVAASLDRIRDLKDQAVAVGDRVQISRNRAGFAGGGVVVRREAMLIQAESEQHSLLRPPFSLFFS